MRVVSVRWHFLAVVVSFPVNFGAGGQFCGQLLALAGNLHVIDYEDWSSITKIGHRLRRLVIDYEDWSSITKIGHRFC